jgi:hypothetical protein
MADQKTELNNVVPAPRVALDNEIRPVTTDTVTPGNVPADYVRKLDREEHTQEHVHGNRTTFDTDTKTDDSAHGQFDNRVLTLVKGALESRQAVEDVRANHRNRNRIYILLTVLVMELIVPTLYGMHLLPKFFLTYEVLAITLPDALLTVYAYLRKY